MKGKQWLPGGTNTVSQLSSITVEMFPQLDKTCTTNSIKQKQTGEKFKIYSMEVRSGDPEICRCLHSRRSQSEGDFNLKVHELKPAHTMSQGRKY